MGFYRGPNVVTDGLVLALDAASLRSYPGSGTTWYDLSGNGSNTTISGTPTLNENGYLEFDGSSNYIDLGSNITLSKDNSTFSGWFYIEDFTTLSGAHTQQARSLAYGPATNHLALIAAWDGGYGFENDINSSPYEVNSTNTPPVPASDITSQKWFNFALSFISGTARGYVNGKFISSVSSPNNLTIRYLGIAATNNNYPDYLYGNMANVKIYNKGLTDSEIQQNYNAQKSRFGL